MDIRRTINRSTSAVVRLVTVRGARLRSSTSNPSTSRTSHLCPVVRVIPNSPHGSVTVKQPLCAKLINRRYCSIGNSFFQGIRPL
jgi:hypothetical protein